MAVSRSMRRFHQDRMEPVAGGSRRWPLDRSLSLLETSLPGVFAVGEVRCGNVKRVASAVGEGSIAVSFVHRVLAEFPDHRDLEDGQQELTSRLSPRGQI
jgi:hypothetical protein